jgi:imidazolonepropionase-like amidohydrolase
MTTRLRILTAALTAALALPAANAGAADPAPALAHTIVLRAARMFDGASGKLVEHPQLTIVGNRIVRIAQGDKADVPAGADVVDLGDATLLPGFIDAHVHLSGSPATTGTATSSTT